MISTSSFLAIGEQDRDRDLDGDGEGDLRDKFCGGVSSLLSGSVGSVNRGNGLVGKENLGIDICGGGGGGGPNDPNGPPKRGEVGASEIGGIPGNCGSLNPGGKTGVIPAMGLLQLGIGNPFFSASSICCKSGG